MHDAGAGGGLMFEGYGSMNINADDDVDNVKVVEAAPPAGSPPLALRHQFGDAAEHVKVLMDDDRERPYYEHRLAA
jgi:hypothetical protein